MKKLILFDIDNTIFDSASFRKDVFQKVSKALHGMGTKKTVKEVEKMVDDLIKKYGFFDPEIFVQLLKHLSPRDKKKIKAFYLDTEGMKNFLYKETIDLIAKFTEIGEVGVLSQGRTRFQLAKITSIYNHFHKERIHIAENKKAEMVTILNKYSKYRVYYVDDMLTMLEKAKEVRNDITTLWIKQGMFAKKQKSIFKPDKQVSNLTEAYFFIKNS
ncbi:MAG: hypothetical protein Q7S38_01045 [bacterium]|nr:hypothetical protein [bacterium]